MEYLCAVLQRSRTTQYDEAQLALFEAGAAMDQKHLAVRYAIPFHGTSHLDYSPICSVHDGRLYPLPSNLSTDCFSFRLTSYSILSLFSRALFLFHMSFTRARSQWTKAVSIYRGGV